MNINSIKFWSFFWRDGIIILFPIELGLILIIPNLNPIWIYILWGITFIIGGLDYIIASIYKMPHIYCVNQSMNHQLITYNPYEMDWKNNFDKKEMIRLGIILIILGVISISGGIIIYLC
jgi:hypothetical protein